MKDIIKAIEIEKTYLDCRLKGEYPFHLVDKIKECGFEDISEYFNEKRKHQLTNINFEYIEKEPKECITEVLHMIDEKVTGILFVDTDSLFIFNGNSEYNEEYCNKNSIPVYPIYTNGGTIVSQAGDFSLGVCCPNNIKIDATFILNCIKDILQKYTNKVITIEGNDLLVDGKKVSGSAVYDKDEMFMFVAHFSFNDSINLINNICKPNKIGKTVGYIDFIDREIFKKEVKSWLQVHSI